MNANQRTGDLALLGNTPQANPITGADGFRYDGLTFQSSLNVGSNIGLSVAAAGDVNGDGFNDFMIGSPGANDINGANQGTGRAYLIYGGSNLVRTNKLVDVDNASTFPTNIITFVNNIPNSNSGASVAGIGDVITDGSPEIAIGAPGANYGALPGSGAVYVISGAAIRSARTTTINLASVGQVGGAAGIIFAGGNAGDRAGTSVAGGFNFDGDRTGANQSLIDFVIGSPQPNTSTGRATMIYGASNLGTFATTVGGVSLIQLSRVGNPVTVGNVPGVIFNGIASGDSTGFAVSSGGDFNADGLGDLMIGTPRGGGNNRGFVHLILGQPNAQRLTGTVNLASIPATVPFIRFNGPLAGGLAGYAISQVGRINNDSTSEILIGVPGVGNGLGAVYLIPGNPDLLGDVDLANAEAQPIAGTLITLSGSVGTSFFGAAVSGRLTQVGQQRTMDSDLVADFILGAPLYGLPTAGTNPPTTTRTNAGTVFGVEGGFVPLQIPISTAIPVTIGIGAPNPPFSIDATNPAALDIYVFSNSTVSPVFRPVTQIDPTTIVVNGVSYSNATVQADPVDQNGDGIADAIVTINPRSNLNLSNGTATITISGRTTAATGSRRFTGAANTTVTGSTSGGGGGSGGPATTFPVGLRVQTTFVPPFGEAFVPTISNLSRFSSYKAIPRRAAYAQFQPQPGFAERQRLFLTGGKSSKTQGLRSRNDFSGSGTHTLGRRVFTRGKFHAGDSTRVKHDGPVIPTQR